MKTNVKTMIDVNFTPEEMKAMDTVWEICGKLLIILEEHHAEQFVEETERLDIIDHTALKGVRNILIDLKDGKNWEVN